MQKLYETKGLTIQDLSEVKKDLKQRMDIQQEQIFTSAKRLVPFTKDSTTINLNKKSLSPLSLITTPIRKGKTISIVEGVVLGYKLMKNARRLFRR